MRVPGRVVGGLGGVVAVLVAVLAVLAAVLAGCDRTSLELNRSVSPCYQAVAVASDALGGKSRAGKFVDVARLTGAELRRMRVGEFPRVLGQPTPPFVPPSALPAPSTTLAVRQRRDVHHAVCLVAYQGSFDAAAIPLQGGRSLVHGSNVHGSYALVVVGVRSRHAAAVFLTNHLPRPLHRH